MSKYLPRSWLSILNAVLGVAIVLGLSLLAIGKANADHSYPGGNFHLWSIHYDGVGGGVNMRAPKAMWATA